MKKIYISPCMKVVELDLTDGILNSQSVLVDDENEATTEDDGTYNMNSRSIWDNEW